jgi:hypothetical protein
VDATTERHTKIEIVGDIGGQHLRLAHLCRAWPLTVLVAAAAAVAEVLAPAYLPALGATIPVIMRLAPGAGSQSRSGQTWLFGLPAPARANVQSDLADVRPAAQPLMWRLAGMISFDDHVAVCPSPTASCSYPGSGLDGRWGIHLDARTTAFTFPSNRFLVYHEIGHAVWGLQLGAAGRSAFADDVRRALRGRPCINDQGRPCAVLTEMFADEFARYAGAFAVSMSYYCTPPLLDPATFGRLVGVAVPTVNPEASPAYLERTAYVRGKVVTIKIRADAPNVREDRGITIEDHRSPAR